MRFLETFRSSSMWVLLGVLFSFLPTGRADDSHIESGRERFARGDLEGACEDLDRGLQTPLPVETRGEGLYLLGQAYLAMGNAEGAVEALTRAAEETAGSSWAVPAAHDLAHLLETQGNWRDAAQYRQLEFNLYANQMDAALDAPVLREILEAFLRNETRGRGEALSVEARYELASLHADSPLGRALLLDLGGASAKPDGNLVRNPGFELDTKEVGPPPVGWGYIGTEPDPMDDVDGTLQEKSLEGFVEVHQGAFAFGKYTEYGTHRAWLYQRVPVSRGKRYACTVFGYTKAPHGAPGRLRLGVDPGGGTHSGSSSVVWTDYRSPREKYEEFGFTVAAAVSASTESLTLFLELLQETPQPRNGMFFDDARVVEVP